MQARRPCAASYEMASGMRDGDNPRRRAALTIAWAVGESGAGACG
jgi:hypothetical protein